MNTLAPAALEHEIAQLITDTLNPEDLDAADIAPNQPHFGEGGLNSDAPKLALAPQKSHGLRIDIEVKHAPAHFATVSSLAAFVREQRTACAD